MTDKHEDTAAWATPPRASAGAKHRAFPRLSLPWLGRRPQVHPGLSVPGYLVLPTYILVVMVASLLCLKDIQAWVKDGDAGPLSWRPPWGVRHKHVPFRYIHVHSLPPTPLPPHTCTHRRPQ